MLRKRLRLNADKRRQLPLRRRRLWRQHNGKRARVRVRRRIVLHLRLLLLPWIGWCILRRSRLWRKGGNRRRLQLRNSRQIVRLRNHLQRCRYGRQLRRILDAGGEGIKGVRVHGRGGRKKNGRTGQ